MENSVYLPNYLALKENLALKSNCCEMVGGKVISIEEARRKRNK